MTLSKANFSSEAIADAISKAWVLGCYQGIYGNKYAKSVPIGGMEMEQILQAAYARQWQGDHNIFDAQQRLASLMKECSNYRNKSIELRAKYTNSQFYLADASDFEKAKRCVRILLKAFTKRIKTLENTVDAYKFLRDWVDQDHSKVEPSDFE